MKQLVMLTAAGLMALVLSACGEDKPKQPEVNQTTTTVQPQKADEAKPAEATTTTTTTQPQE
jgi:uncharacterized lipoprotein YbaY